MSQGFVLCPLRLAAGFFFGTSTATELVSADGAVVSSVNLITQFGYQYFKEQQI
jgi:hypothetical protein